MNATEGGPTAESDAALYDAALRVTDEVLGAGAYAALNAEHPDPGVQGAIQRWRARVNPPEVGAP